MPYTFSYEVPGNRAVYKAVDRAIGSEPPGGLIALLVIATPQGLRHTMVWESESQWQEFQRTRIAPAVAQTLAAAGIPAPGKAPDLEMIDLVDIWVPQALTKTPASAG